MCLRAWPGRGVAVAGGGAGLLEVGVDVEVDMDDAERKPLFRATVRD